MVSTQVGESSLPIGRYVGTEIDPDTKPFLLSIGSTEEIATRFGSCKMDLTFSKTGDKSYVLNISQPPINRNQDTPFTLDEEQVTTMFAGQTMKSLFEWIPTENQLRCTYSNSDGANWTIVYNFRPDGLTMVRDSATVHSSSEFQLNTEDS